jgi:N-acetylglutamate synthase-like GNAT family acetyltransferase
MNGFTVRRAALADLDAIKELADTHKNELGFVLRPALARSVAREELLVAENHADVVGFVEYHHRQDHQTTLYHIVVDLDHRGMGVGRALINALRDEARDLGKSVIQLKCPADLQSRSFYGRVGFQSVGKEPGKNRCLVVFNLEI